MPIGARNKTVKVDHKRRIAELYLRGINQHTIAAELGISQGQVSLDLKSIRKEWLDSSLFDFNARQAEELAKIDNLEATYWTAWERSLKDVSTKTKRAFKSLASEASSNEISETVQQKTGDPRYLEGIRWCIDKRCEILGLNAPIKINNTQPITQMSQVERDETLKKLIEIKNANRLNVN